MSTKSLNLRLRPEARPIDIERLFSGQQEVLHRVLYMIGEAVDLLTESTSDKKVETFEPQTDRFSRSVFVSGARGTGKTSVLLSLVNASLGRLKIPDGKSRRFRDALEKLRDRTIWLDPIDMDPLPSPFALLPSIFVRFEASLRALLQTDQQRYLSHAQTVTDSLFDELDHLLTEATLAWESNILERKPHLDPDEYSHEMRRGNDARIQLNTRFGVLLRRFGEEISKYSNKKDPLFVVVIDDFDLHPSACLQVLRILRMLSIPRIFYVMLGDINLLEVMTELSTQHEVSQLADGHTSDRLRQLTSSIAQNALRKMLPHEQRVIVGNATITEGMDYRPQFKSKTDNPSADFQLVSMFRQLPFIRPNPFPKNNTGPFSLSLCGTKCTNLLRFLFHPGFKSITNLNENTTSAKSNEGSSEIAQGIGAYGELLTLNFESINSISVGEPLDLAIPGPPRRNFQSSGQSPDQQVQLPSVLDIFSLPARRLSDLWFALRWLVDCVQRDLPKLIDDCKASPADLSVAKSAAEKLSTINTLLLEKLSQICRDSVLEDTQLRFEQRERIREAMVPNAAGVWDWSTLPFELRAELGLELVMSGANAWARNRRLVPVETSVDAANQRRFALRNLYIEISARKVSGLDLGVCGDAHGSTQMARPQTLCRADSALFTLFHDLTRLSSTQERITSNFLVPEDIPNLLAAGNKRDFDNPAIHPEVPVWGQWSSTVYKGKGDESQQLFWPVPGIRSVSGLDMFRRSWNRAIDAIQVWQRESTNDKVNVQPENFERLKVEMLAFAWISGSCAVAESEQPVQAQPKDFVEEFKPNKPDHWTRLFMKINDLARKYLEQSLENRNAPKAMAFKQTLQNIALLLMPESGLPTRLMYRLIFGLPVSASSPKFFELDPDELRYGPQVISRYLGGNCLELVHFENQICTWAKGFFNLHQDAGKAEVPQIPEKETHTEFWPDEFFVGLKSKSGKKSDSSWKEMLVRALSELPFIKFLNEFKQNIRSWRGLRLGKLAAVANGQLSERLRRSQCVQLVHFKHREKPDLDFTHEYGPGAMLFLDKHFSLGRVFESGGLVPHRNEIVWPRTAPPRIQMLDLDWDRQPVQIRDNKDLRFDELQTHELLQRFADLYHCLKVPKHSTGQKVDPDSIRSSNQIHVSHLLPGDKEQEITELLETIKTKLIPENNGGKKK